MIKAPILLGGVSLWRIAFILASLAGFTAYVVVSTFAAVIAPPAAGIFILPILIGIFAVAPQRRAMPKRLALTLIFMSAILLPLWPVYLHVKIGPAPIITPPRLVLYLLSAMWIYDMAVSPIRRAQFALAVRRSAPVTMLVFALFGLGLMSLPLAEGRAIAVPEFFRQAIIHLLPFCAVMTYIRRRREFLRFIQLLTIGACVSGAIALVEIGSGTLLASLLSPFISDNAEWLRLAQSQKIRDGVFRAQASHTHPLSLGEFLSMTAPLALAFCLSARTRLVRFAWAGGLILVIAGALATNSRGAMMAIAVAMAVSGLILFYRFLQTAAADRYRPLAGLITAGVLAASPLIGLAAHGVITGSAGAQAAKSSQSRVEQIEMAWPKIMKRPVGGYGTGRSARILGYFGRALTIDNYYLTLAIDMGLPGPIVFFGLIAAFGVVSLKRSRDGPLDDRLIYVGLAASAAAFAVSRTIISQTGNLSILYVLLGAFAGAAATAGVRARRRRQSAISAG